MFSWRSAPVLAASAIALAIVIAAGAAADDGEPAFDAIGCDAAAGGDLTELIEDQPDDRTIPTPEPVAWRESRGRQCHRYRGRRVCDGPRRVPEPHGPAAELARQLGLDDEARVTRTVMRGPAPPEWIAAVDGGPSAGLLWPVPDGRFWRGYGMHRSASRPRSRRRVMHDGVDIGAAVGTPMRAVNDALVVYSNNGMRGYGNTVLLLHADGTITLYAHCHATYVFAGQRVERGQVIAEVGHTGLAHGAHLHFEWLRDGRAIDPEPFFVGRPDETDDAPPELPDGA